MHIHAVAKLVEMTSGALECGTDGPFVLRFSWVSNRNSDPHGGSLPSYASDTYIMVYNKDFIFVWTFSTDGYKCILCIESVRPFQVDSHFDVDLPAVVGSSSWTSMYSICLWYVLRSKLARMNIENSVSHELLAL